MAKTQIDGGKQIEPGTVTLGAGGDVIGTLRAVNGGTGITDPGSAGNVLTSTGTAWSSTPSAAAATFKSRIATAETPDNVTTMFTVGDVFVAGSLTAYLNGLEESNVSETTTHSFTFTTAPLIGDTVETSYVFSSIYTPPGGGPLGVSLGLDNL